LHLASLFQSRRMDRPAPTLPQEAPPHPAHNGITCPYPAGSGDSTIKVWDFERQSCVQTFTDHTQAVWEVRFHDQGDYLASCSLDHSVRLWDINLGKCRQVLRGHVDSVNDICWQPFTSNIATGEPLLY
jgi:WD40 repeat protein